MKLERAIYRSGYLWFAGFFLCMLAGFWMTYFTRLGEQENFRMHLHGIGLVTWCLMLVTQAGLIRTKRYDLHRAIGRTSYLLVPWILWTTFDLFHFTMGGATDMPARGYVFTAAVILALVIYPLFYGLAIWNRKRPSLHARFMVCTAFPLFTPITDRIIGIYIPGLIQYLPTVDGPVMQSAGLSLATLLLAGLAIWDWRSHRRVDVFAFALAVEAFYFYGVMNFHRFAWWRGFSDWITGT